MVARTGAQAASNAPPATDESGRPERVVHFNDICLADVRSEQISWLWYARIPYGKLSIIEGHPGVGKSTLTTEIAARVSRGDALPGGDTTPPGNVLLLTAEDGLGDTVRPRIEAANGNLFMIHALPEIQYESGEPRMPTIPEDIPALEIYIARNDIRLLVIDPLSAYLAGEVNSFKDHDVRRALSPLAAMAERTACAVLVVRHLTKASSGQAIVAGGGSIGIIGQARSAMLVATDPENPRETVLAVVKSNLARKPESLKFELVTSESGWARVEWIGVSPHSADALIAAGRDHDDAGPLEEAMQLLGEWLRPGAKPKSEVMRAARDAGISTRTLERAKQKMGVIHVRTGFGPGSRTTWQLPSPPSDSYIYENGEDGENHNPTSSGSNDLASSPMRRTGVASMEPDYLSPEEEQLYLAQLAREREPA